MTKFGAKLEEGITKQIPCLNTLPKSEWKQDMLVRYVGMVQDTWNPERYAPLYVHTDAATQLIVTISSSHRPDLSAATKQPNMPTFLIFMMGWKKAVGYTT